MGIVRKILAYTWFRLTYWNYVFCPSVLYTNRSKAVCVSIILLSRPVFVF